VTFSDLRFFRLFEIVTGKTAEEEALQKGGFSLQVFNPVMLV